MSTPISQRVSQLAASATLVMAQRATEMKAEGIDVINLSIGEPDFPTPEHISRAAEEAIRQHITHYTTVDGLLPLRQAVCDKLRKENGLKYDPAQIVISTGAKQSICNAILSLVEEGDEVLLPTPTWLSYTQMIALSGAVCIELPTTIEQNYKLTPQQLEAAITPRTKLLILCSPSNPTGSVYNKEEISALATVLRRHPQVYVISDEIYEHIRYTAEPHCSLAQQDDLKDRIIIVNGVSKAYAMTGWRIGWLAAHPDIAKACKKLQGQYTSCASSISQMAALEAYNGPQDCVETMRRVFQNRRNLVLSLASQLPNIRFNQPDGAFYLLMDVKAYIGKKYQNTVITDSAALTLFLLEQGHVTLVDGAPFGASGTIRLSYAASEDDIQEAFRRLRSTLALLN